MTPAESATESRTWCEICQSLHENRRATEVTTYGTPVCRECYLASIEADLRDLVRISETVDWRAVEGIDVQEADAWTRRLRDAHDAQQAKLEECR